MAAQSDSLLIDSDPVGKYGSLGYYPALVYSRRADDFIELLEKSFPVLFHCLGRVLLYYADKSLDILKL